MTARIERIVTSGIFNNIWLVGDDDEVLVIDAAHDAGPIASACIGRRVVGTRTISSSERELFTLPDETVVKTGHGDDTTIGAERHHERSAGSLVASIAGHGRAHDRGVLPGGPDVPAAAGVRGERPRQRPQPVRTGRRRPAGVLG